MPEAKAEAKPEAKTEAKPKRSGIPEVIKAFAWPLTLLLLVFFFWGPLHKLVGVLPDALANSETVTMGSLSLRVGKRLSEGANQEVRDALSGMTAADMTVVLENPLEGSSVSYGGIPSELLDHWVKLEQLGMVTRESDEELTLQAKLTNSRKPFSVSRQPQSITRSASFFWTFSLTLWQGASETLNQPG
jgi:hypothetical protein